MHAPTFEIDEVHLLSEDKKFEGITLYKESENELEFLLCDDDDMLSGSGCNPYSLLSRSPKAPSIKIIWFL